MIRITINGEPKTIEAECSVAELLDELKINSRAIAVEINQELKPRDRHKETQVQDGDVLEIVTLVGGG